MDWIHVNYLWIIVMFLSAVWTRILTAPIHCRMKTQTHLHLALSESEDISGFFKVWVNYSFNKW